jgi:hypothetical protein
MAYIGYQPSYLAVAPFATKSFTGDGTTTTFTLDQSVPGANEANVEVVVENVQQNPIDAFIIGGALNNQLIFSEAPVSGASIYVIHSGEATYNLQPATGSVTAATLDPVLRNFTVNNFTGDGTTTSFTLTDTPYSANSILVTVDGIVQTASTNYTVSGTTLSFGTSAPDNGAVITVVHMGFSSGNKAVMDASITPVKLSTGGPWWSTAGNFAIGLTSANNNKLTVYGQHVGGRSLVSIRTSDATTGAPAIIGFYNSADARVGSIGANIGQSLSITTQESVPIIFNTVDTERMRIDTRGKVGIAATPANWKSTWPALDIGQAASFYSQDNNTTGIGSNLYFTGSTWGRKTLGAAALYQLSEGVHYWYSNPSGAADSTFSPTTVMQLEANGQLTLPYGQIKFPAVQNASADANTLDDYEEGTWTPQAGSESGAFTQTGSFTGKYLKIGSRVWASFDCSLASRTLTGSLGFLHGLPFPVANNGDLSGGAGSVNITFNHGTNFYQLGMYPQNNSTYCYFTTTTSNTSGLTVASNALWGASTRICGGVWYNTTA